MTGGLGDPSRPALKPQFILAGSGVIRVAGSPIITLEMGFLFYMLDKMSSFEYHNDR